MARLGLSSPWVIFYNELNAFFKDDSKVNVIYDEDKNVINLYVDNAEKAAALTELLPTEKTFGAVTLQINVIPANRINSLKLAAAEEIISDGVSLAQLYRSALSWNEAVYDIVEIQGVFTNPITYILFKKEVVQYFNDSLGDIHGLCSTLMQEIAKNIFDKQEGIYFCTSNVPDSSLCSATGRF